MCGYALERAIVNDLETHHSPRLHIDTMRKLVGLESQEQLASLQMRWALDTTRYCYVPNLQPCLRRWAVSASNRDAISCRLRIFKTTECHLNLQVFTLLSYQKWVSFHSMGSRLQKSKNGWFKEWCRDRLTGICRPSRTSPYRSAFQTTTTSDGIGSSQNGAFRSPSNPYLYYSRK